VRLYGRMPREPSCSDSVVGACSRRSRPCTRLAVVSIRSVGLPRNWPGITPPGRSFFGRLNGTRFAQSLQGDVSVRPCRATEKQPSHKNGMT